MLNCGSNAQATPIRVTLSCGWCGREFEDIEAELDPQTGHVRLVGSAAPFAQRGGQAVCAHCGGPLFVTSWRVTRHDAPRLALIA
jgi:hypothetical protein